MIEYQSLNMECPVLGYTKSYKGKSANSSLQQHLKASHKDYALQSNKQQPVRDPRTVRKEINAWYKAKYPRHRLTLTRMKQIKGLAEKLLEKENLARKPQRLLPPVLNTIVDKRNVYWILEERYGLFVGRLKRIYDWNRAAKKVTRFSKQPIFNEEVGDEWEAYLSYSL
ncbi:hypothetical protein BGX38DRAFT_1278484 [Terfezia claveryi]|nr:hypothetical protein BGX38DRAFT_1278484 [Terfezia claveryi]